MQVHRYTSAHYIDLNTMLASNDHPTLEESSIPAIGYVASDDQGIAAMAFIRRCEGDLVVLLDGLVSNPLYSPRDRNEALDLVVLACLAKAKELNIKQVLAFSRNESVLLRSLKLGFVKHPTHSVITFDLTRKAQ